MTDFKDEGDEEGGNDDSMLDASQMGMLEHMLQAHARDHFEKAQTYPGGVKEYFRRLVSDVTQDYKNHRAVERNIYDFSVDRYIFYRRHREMDNQDAITEAYIDTFQYLVELKNSYPTVLPKMRDIYRD
jgi:hypothetical protein